VLLVDISERGGTKMNVTQRFPAVHLKASSTAVCVLENQIYSGSDTGEIVRISPTSHRKKDQAFVVAADLMSVRCLTPIGNHQMVSGHSTGQIHLWDVRLLDQRRVTSVPRVLDSNKGPTLSRAVTTLNDAITSLTTHPAQSNVIAFGTNSGSVSFMDVRQPKEIMPNLFKVSQDPINHLKFHPIYANNCFSSSDSGVIHWDASSLHNDTLADGLDDTSMMEVPGGHTNVWLSGKAWGGIQLRALVEEDPRLISSFDVSLNSLVVGSHTGTLAYVEDMNLC